MDVGYTNYYGFLAPYRGQRYHLSEFDGGPQSNNSKEYFNLKHSAARNVIERCFGVLKNRWAILRMPSFYPIKTQNRIIMACCLLHDFIRREMPNDPYDVVVPNEQDNDTDDEDELYGDPITTIETSDEWSTWRTNLAQQMFDEWRNH